VYVKVKVVPSKRSSKEVGSVAAIDDDAFFDDHWPETGGVVGADLMGDRNGDVREMCHIGPSFQLRRAKFKSCPARLVKRDIVRRMTERLLYKFSISKKEIIGTREIQIFRLTRSDL
jgi:hypothetical protein